MSKAHKVALIGTMGLPPRYGGFETLVHYLVTYLGDTTNLIVYCSGPEYDTHPRSYLSAHLRYIPIRANGAQSVLFDFVSLLDSIFHADTILLLGVSGGIFVPLTRMFGKKVVLNIGGLDWQRSKWGKWASRFLRLSESIAIRFSTVLIADNEGIASYLYDAYHRQSILIEYGGDQVTLPPVTAEWLRKYSFLDTPYAFSVARIQPDNNIEMILQAFDQAKNHTFVMVGNWSSSAFGRDLKSRFSGRSNVHLLDAIYDPEELNVLRGHCSIYVHGHSAGGTNPSLVEAMHLSLPIAAFDVVYNRATTEGSARYFKSASELASLLNYVSPPEWESQRAIMKEIANRRYCWSTIAKKYSAALNA